MQQSSPGQRVCTTPLSLSQGSPAILESIVSSLSDSLVVADQNGRVLLFNGAAERLLEADAWEAALSQWPERYGFYLADRRTLFPADQLPLARAVRGENAEAVELFVRNPVVPDGAWVAASATPLRDETGRLRGGIALFRDITEQKRAEEALRKERDWAAGIVEAVGTLVVVLDREGRIVSFNRTCEWMTGYTSEELRGRPLWETLLVPGEAEPVRRGFEYIREGRFPSQHENYWVAKDGRPRLIAWTNTALLDAGGAVEYIIGTGMDITDRARTADELRQANGTLRAVIETSPLAIVAMDLKGIVKTWNRAAEEIFGWLAREVIGQPFPIVPDEDEEFFRNNLERLQRGETIVNVERQRRRRDGTIIDVALWNAPQRDGLGNVIGGISVIADMTDRKRLEDQFRQAQKMEAVGRLAGGVAHDFNNLLTVITGYTQMLFEGLEPEHPMRSYVEEIVRASGSAAALTNQLLAFSRRQIVSPQVLDLNTLVSGMDKLLHRLIGEDIDLVTSLAPGLPRVRVDAGQFEQVMMNLAVNARDAMPNGGKLLIQTDTAVIAGVSPDGVAPGNYVLLSVSDTGKGMSEETRHRIFEPFFTTKGRGKGTGLGLSTVFGIVKQAGGEVVVESEPGSGSTFRIYLPVVERAVAAGAESGALPERKTGTETVLVVEDQSELRKLVREVLESHGYTVLNADDFRAALRIAETYSGPIHLCLTDMVMPGMSGRELASRVQQLRPKVKLLYMSGYTDHAALELEEGETVPGTHFLQKPFPPEVLLAKIREVLDR